MTDETGPLDALTQKQREVLDLLVQFKTSKEIAIVLGVSPHTVDQRIQYAKRVFGVEARSELAQRYRAALQTYGRMTYEDSHVPNSDPPEQIAEQDNLPNPIAPNATNDVDAMRTNAGRSVVPELFEGRNGVLFRLGAIAMTAFLLVMVALGGIAIFSVVSDMMAM